MTRYDIIFAGGGLSGLTMALELARRPFFRDKSILLIDREEKQRNDRTWCFWATADEPLPPVVYKTWDRCLFFSKNVEKTLEIAPFRYCMVRGIDFYTWAKEELAKCPNVQRITTTITGLEAEKGIVHTDLGDFEGEWVLNSAFTPVAILPEANGVYERPAFTVQPDLVPHGEKGGGKPRPHVYLLQHFKGWIIETPEPVFDPGTATLMDFRIEQRGETRFVYVLPLSEREALVEFTVFSPALCTAEEYASDLRNYIDNYLKIKEFTIKEEEFGVIPMSDYPFTQSPGSRTIHIGTAGGFVKGSSGYAFKRTQRKSRLFADAWVRDGRPSPTLLRSPWRYRMFDSIMLRVLKDGLEPGHDLFSDLFRKLPAPLVFRFLDEDSTFAEEFRLIMAPATIPFLKAAWRQLPLAFKI